MLCVDDVVLMTAEEAEEEAEEAEEAEAGWSKKNKKPTWQRGEKPPLAFTQ